MSTNPDISLLITRAGLSEAELLDFVEGELSVERSAEILGQLTEHPELRDVLIAMRGDRGELEHELELLASEPDSSFVESTVHQGVTGEFDAAFAAKLEAGGGGTIPRMHRPQIRRVRSFRFPAATVGGLLAASLAGVVGVAAWLAWPSAPVSPAPTQIADADPEVLGDGLVVDEFAASDDLDQGGEVALAVEDESREVQWAGTTTIETPAEALAAAEEGRLIIRVFSPVAESGHALVESVTTAASVSRVAVLRGPASEFEAGLIAGAVPTPSGPVFASELDQVDAGSVDRPEIRSSRVYMIEVEPTERGVSLLLAGLSREPGMVVELLRSDRPVTTPGSVDDMSWFRGPSRSWTRRIAAPVIVQSSEPERAR